ncbi:MAG TPA: TraR/DksA C4-type zinc finger protein [Candidatus Margulisiibacteriota bacterium]|nr:TraR/DksA C4-type zinc finger protein [Candidatus Margulisiibacteriota bacterium]
MNPKTIESLAKVLRHQRGVLFKEAAGAEADLAFIAEDRETDFEERGQEERAARLFARLDVRAKHAIEEIDAALQRIAAGTYGTCSVCGRAIPAKRLQALPATPFCLECAHAHEAGGIPVVEEEAPASRSGPLPTDLSLMTDREVETALRERVHEDGRIDMDELRIVCRHGAVYLDGAVPSEAEHQMLLKLVTDIEGFQEVIDRLQVKEILWERPERSKPAVEEPAPSRLESTVTEDVVKSTEEGIEYVPPIEPPPEEE